MNAERCQETGVPEPVRRFYLFIVQASPWDLTQISRTECLGAHRLSPRLFTTPTTNIILPARSIEKPETKTDEWTGLSLRYIPRHCELFAHLGAKSLSPTLKNLFHFIQILFKFIFFTLCQSIVNEGFFNVPEILNVHMNEIYKKITKKSIQKNHFLSQNLIFHCLKKKNSKKK